MCVCIKICDWWFEYSCLVGFFFGGSDANEVVFSSVAYLCYVKFVYALYLARVRILIKMI